MKIARLLVLALCACGSGSAADTTERGAGIPNLQEPPGSGGAGGSGGAPTPERELESLYEAPVATKNFLWVANPRSGRVAFVDAASLRVRTVEAGNGPKFLAPVPSQTGDTVLVTNELSNDASLLSAEGDALTAERYALTRGTNSWTVDRGGAYAVAWTDARKVESPDKLLGFQDITVLSLKQKTSTTVSVGYRPVAVAFSTAAAYVVTADGISVIALGETPVRVTKNIPLSSAPLSDPGTRDVSITEDGRYALIRRDGSNVITGVELATGTRTDITLAGAVTDLDLSPTGDFAIAVVRELGTCVVLPIPGVIDGSKASVSLAIAGEQFGSVQIAQNGGVALLYTNVGAVERLAILTSPMDNPMVRTVRLYSPVLAAFLTHDGAHAVVLHETVTIQGSEDKGAYSMVPTKEGLLPKIVGVPAPVQAVALASDRALITFRDDKTATHGVDLGFFPSLETRRLSLASPATATGILEHARRGYVAQSHPDGRVTFLDLDGTNVRTLTGFELTSRVVE